MRKGTIAIQYLVMLQISQTRKKHQWDICAVIAKNQNSTAIRPYSSAPNIVTLHYICSMIDNANLYFGVTSRNSRE